ncbi:hypothetical protein HCN44_009024 [Aphidius gifuensis]|uniref:Mitochondrial import inner membrane translocase subunit TIM50 n=1 Tax=Aphidius gifuensis TaxID=684658 RepID=A0A834XQ45_APHGI|nr:mitochondrial import inner membrane translocase subunit TIM50-C-like [Aphidius gifuensis]KAF7990081.1 hypothetical protein HCN44_009024 [Aphidius gifuensis]
MAFAIRSLRILCKKSNVSCNTSYSTLGKPLMRLNLISASPKLFFHSSGNKTISPKIGGKLSSNIRSSPIAKLVENFNDSNQDDPISRQKKEQEEEEEYRKQREQSWKMMKWSFILFGVATTIGGSLFIYELVKPTYDEDGKIIEDEFSQLPFYEMIWKRLCKELNYYKKFVQEPSGDKLLPDPLKYPFMQPPYTLVLEMTDLLVHPDWTYQTGWRFKKRPGVDQFLEQLTMPNFEIVVYTAEQGHIVFPILDSLDRNGYIMYRLVRDATRFIDGHHVKDLDALNRDLSKVIVIDWNPNNVKLHPQNALVLPRWNGNDDDTTLNDLAAFLKMIHATNVADVRDVITYYQQFDNPLEAFRENQRKLLQQMEDEKMQKQQMQNSKTLTSRWRSSFVKPQTS